MRDILEKLVGWGIIILLAISFGYIIHIILDHTKSKTELNRANVDFLNRSSINLQISAYRNHGETYVVR